jgi:hypothetical protein
MSIFMKNMGSNRESSYSFRCPMDHGIYVQASIFAINGHE